MVNNKQFLEEKLKSFENKYNNNNQIDNVNNIYINDKEEEEQNEKITQKENIKEEKI